MIRDGYSQGTRISEGELEQIRSYIEDQWLTKIIRENAEVGAKIIADGKSILIIMNIAGA